MCYSSLPKTVPFIVAATLACNVRRLPAVADRIPLPVGPVNDLFAAATPSRKMMVPAVLSLKINEHAVSEYNQYPTNLNLFPVFGVHTVVSAALAEIVKGLKTFVQLGTPGSVSVIISSFSVSYRFQLFLELFHLVVWREVEIV